MEDTDQDVSEDADLLEEAPAVAVQLKGAKDPTSRVLSALKRTKSRDSTAATKGGSDYSRSVMEVKSSARYVIKTGLDPLDEATGGIPFAHVTEIFGLDSSGKTALTMHICGSAKQGEIYERLADNVYRKVENAYVVILYLDNENSLEKGDRMLVCGREIDTIVGECDTVDRIFKDTETMIAELAKIRKANPAMPIFGIVVVDTIAGTSTAEEIGSEWGARDYSRQPKALRDGFRNIIRKLKTENVAVICTNQVGDSFKPKLKSMVNKSPIPQESDFTAFGGKALRYYAHLRIFVVATPNPYKLSPGQFPDGIQIHFFVKKNRIRPPLRAGRLVLLYKNCMHWSDTEWEQTVRPQLVDEIVKSDLALRNVRTSREQAEERVPMEPPGGYSRLYSILEHLAYMKLLTYSAGRYRVNFSKYGIGTTAAAPSTSATFDLADLTGEIEEGAVEFARGEWPQFYASHALEVQQLFMVAVDKMFKQNVGGETDTDGETTDISDED